MDKLSEAQVFVSIAENGSIAGAARALGREPSRVSRILNELEKRLGVTLANRTTRSLHLTEAGLRYRYYCEEALSAIATGEEVTRNAKEALSGRLRILGVNIFSQPEVMKTINAFSDSHPAAHIGIKQVNKLDSSIQSDSDLALHIGETSAKTLFCNPILPSQRIICASPFYVEKYGTPNTIHDLEHHKCIGITQMGPSTWEIENQNEIIEFFPNFSMSANRADIIRSATLEGMGISQLASVLVAPEIKNGKLVQLFPRRKGYVTNYLCAIYRRHPSPTKLMVTFVEYIKRELSEVLALPR